MFKSEDKYNLIIFDIQTKALYTPSMALSNLEATQHLVVIRPDHFKYKQHLWHCIHHLWHYQT